MDGFFLSFRGPFRQFSPPPVIFIKERKSIPKLEHARTKKHRLQNKEQKKSTENYAQGLFRIVRHFFIVCCWFW